MFQFDWFIGFCPPLIANIHQWSVQFHVCISCLIHRWRRLPFLGFFSLLLNPPLLLFPLEPTSTLLVSFPCSRFTYQNRRIGNETRIIRLRRFLVNCLPYTHVPKNKYTINKCRPFAPLLILCRFRWNEVLLFGIPFSFAGVVKCRAFFHPLLVQLLNNSSNVLWIIAFRENLDRSVIALHLHAESSALLHTPCTWTSSAYSPKIATSIPITTCCPWNILHW